MVMDVMDVLRKRVRMSQLQKAIDHGDGLVSLPGLGRVDCTTTTH